MNPKALSLSAIVVLVAAAMPAQQAQAADDFKFVAASDCVPYQPTTAAHEVHLSYAGLHNPGTTVEAVLCPMPRDQDDPYLTGDVDVTVYYRANGGSGRLTCTLFVGTSNMQSTAVYTNTVSGPFVANGTRTSLAISGASQSQAFWAVPVNVLCYLDPKMSLAGVFFNESGPTNVP
jgi:hypothetical protein